MVSRRLGVGHGGRYPPPVQNDDTRSPLLFHEFLTSALPGTGGTLRQRLTDFEVDEVPVRAPSGRGDFAWARIEKRGIGTPELLGQLATALGVPLRELGCAGNKDARAVARQWVSLPARALPRLARAKLPGAAVLEAARDRAPLALGDLRGNRFRITVREVGASAAALARAQPILDVLAARGCPSFFGPQRFGSDGSAVEHGRAIVRGTSRRPWPERERRLFLSAWQSLLFNRILAARLPRFDRALEGDVLLEPRSGRTWSCADPAREQAGLDEHRVHPTAPLVGIRAPLAAGEPGEIERAVLAEEGVTREQLEQAGGLSLPGERRALRFFAKRLELTAPESDVLVLAFELPRGCFATALVAEVMK